MRVRICALFAACIAASSCLGLAAEAGQGLVWRLAALKWAETDYVSVPFKRPIKASAGDSFQVFVQADSECFCYVIAKDAGGSLEVVLDAKLKPHQGVFLPDPDNDFGVTAGADSLQKLYVIVSAEPQPKLESLIAKTKDFKAGGAAEGVESAIFALRDQGSSLAMDPEKPVAMGGVTRGKKTLSANEATQFEGRTLYVKTISFER